MHISEVAKDLSFTGKIMYAGYQINDKDIELLTKIPDFIWFKTIEAFSNRSQLMPSPKGSDAIDTIAHDMEKAQKNGVQVSYFYIAGLDSVAKSKSGMEALSFVDEPPNINLFDIYNAAEWKIQNKKYSRKPLEYIFEIAESVSTIHYNGKTPDRGRLDSAAGLWAPKSGVFEQNRAYVLGNYWDNNSLMGPQGQVQII